ncbi:MAG: gamma-glutamylcyclotransferase [Verrucomicrobia bacterium]|nr:gamma-glutamylcyclotransferase [Verrucomicrobiota bacterium]
MRTILLKIAIGLSALLSSMPLVAEAQPLANQEVLKYPFGEKLKQKFTERGEERVLIFSYGSLMNRTSAARTLSADTLATRKAAIAVGIKRVFNYDPQSTSRGAPENPLERGMLNVIHTGDATDAINGVVVEMKLEDAVALSEREIGYDLIPVTVYDWETGENPRTAYTFRAAEDAVYKGHKLVKTDIYPRPEYYATVMAGANEFGDQFAHTFLKTTYLADGKTSLCAWAKAGC